MELLYYGLKNRQEFDKKRNEEIKKYKNSTLLDAALNNTIKYIRGAAEELEQSTTPANYKQKYSEFLYCVILKLQCFQGIVVQIRDFYQSNQRDQNTSLLALLSEGVIQNGQEICSFFEKNDYRQWNGYNRDNYSTLENHVRIISMLKGELLRIQEEFVKQPYAAAARQKLNDKITIMVKSSAKKYCMALLHCVKQVRQIRWLAWFENYLYRLLFDSIAAVSPSHKYIVLFPEFFFVDIYDNPAPPKVSDYVKPFYEDIARYFTGLRTDFPTVSYLEESFHHMRLKELTALYPNLIIFAGTIIWKTKEKRLVYTNGEQVLTKKRWKFKPVETDTFYNTAVLFSGGRCCYLWDKQFISGVDGTGGVKVVHQHEIPSEPDLHYIKSSMSMEMQIQEPVFRWISEGENITFLISVCLDFAALSEKNYFPQPDIHILIAADAPMRKEFVKGQYFWLGCDGGRRFASFCYDIQNKIAYQPDEVLEFYRFAFQLPDVREEFSVCVTDLMQNDHAFYEKALEEGLVYRDLTESAVFEADRDFDCICIDNSVETEIQVTTPGAEKSEGLLTIRDGSDVFTYSVTLVPSVDPDTNEPRVELALSRESKERNFSLSEVLLFAGNMSHDFLEAIQLPLGVPGECKFYFYENGHRTYHLSFRYNQEIPLIKNLLTLENACLDIIRSDDIYQYTLSAVVDIAGCALEFGIISGSLDLVQAYFKPASEGQSFPGLGQFAAWALGGQTEDFKNLAEFRLLDLSLVSVKAYIRTSETPGFEEIVIKTRLTLFSLVFAVDVSVIGKQIQGYLEMGQEKKSISDIIDSMFASGQAPAVPKALQTLYVEQAKVSADIKGNTYQISFQISGVWEEGMVRIDCLKMSFVSSPKGKDISFYGQITLFETLTAQVGIFDNNGIWSIQGGVAIPDGKSLFDLFSSFGWQSPDVFKRISLNYVTIFVTPETGDLQFDCSAVLQLETLLMQFHITACKSKESADYTGEMRLSKAGEGDEAKMFQARFLVEFQDVQGKEELSFRWDREAEFSITDFCELLGFEGFELPEFLDISIACLEGSFDFKKKEFRFLAETADCSKLYIQSSLSGNTRQVIFGIALDMKLSLDQLPVVGDCSPIMKEVGLYGLKVLVLSEDCSHVTIKPLDIADQEFQRGICLSTDLRLSDVKIPLNLAIPSVEQKNALKAGIKGQDEKSKQASVRIDKHIGPFTIRKIGLSYGDKALDFMLDSDFTQGALSFGLEDLGIGYQIREKKPSFLLKGLSVAVKTDAISIGGSFQRVNPYTYRGSLLMGLKSFQLTAYGAYTAKPAHSAFVFALLKAAIGGPPCFSITGIAAGFGYNRNLSLPDIEHLAEFPFLKAVSGKLSSDEIFEKEMTYFPLETGENWIAAGVLFHSFKMIDSIAMLTVKFGNETEIHLLGKSVINVPYQAEKPIGHAVLLLNASFVPAGNLISVEAVLSSESYILSKDCHLTGSFAFYTWYGGPHRGDFVVTLGGYHRLYQKPKHYPDARRLGLNWEIAKGLTALGEIYFAITPSALMAGGLLKLQYTASCVEAWFDAHMDILLQWKPYHYDLRIGVNIGVRVHLKLFTAKLELGCDLHIWGPEFSGTVKVKLWIISFTISFGQSENQSAGCIDTKEFVSSFLPEAKGREMKNNAAVSYDSCTIAVSNGMVKELEMEDGKKAIVLCAQNFEVTVKSCVPANSISFMQKTVSAHSLEAPVKVRPCGDLDLDSEMVILLERKDGLRIEEEFILDVVTENLPSALWAPKDWKEETISVKTGLIVRPKPFHYYQLSYQEDFHSISIPVCMMSPAAFVSKKYEQGQAFAYLMEINRENQKRKAILKGLGDEFLDVRLVRLGANPKEVFTEQPLIATIGGNQLWTHHQ